MFTLKAAWADSYAGCVYEVYHCVVYSYAFITSWFRDERLEGFKVYGLDELNEQRIQRIRARQAG